MADPTDKVKLLSQGVVDFLERKNLKPAFHWQDVFAQEHAHSFTVAKSTQHNILQDVKDALIDAEKSGKGFKAFKEGLKPKLIKKGWWGKRAQIDPLTGESVVAQLGSDRRLKTIYRANIRSARAAGQWERAQRTKKTLPYFVYQLGASEHHRQHHVAIAGTILPIDNSFWDTHFPPNGWGCNCRVRQITKAEAGRKNYDPKKAAPKITYKEHINKRTGEVHKVPTDIDVGWHTNAGKSRAETLMQHLSGRLNGAGEVAAKSTVQELWKNEKYINTIAKLPNEKRVHIPIAISNRVAKAFKTDKPAIMISTDVLNLKRETRKAEKFDLEFADFGKVQSIIDDGELVYDKRYKNYAIFKQIAKDWFKVVVNVSKGGYLRVQTFHPINEADMKKFIKRRQK